MKGGKKKGEKETLKGTCIAAEDCRAYQLHHRALRVLHMFHLSAAALQQEHDGFDPKRKRTCEVNLKL